MARTMSSSSGQRTSRSTSGSWMPTLSGAPVVVGVVGVMVEAYRARALTTERLVPHPARDMTPVVRTARQNRGPDRAT